VLLASRHVTIRDEVGLGPRFLCWECWEDICASAMIGYEIRTAKGEATRVTR
jgi:hypothetical protein